MSSRTSVRLASKTVSPVSSVVGAAMAAFLMVSCGGETPLSKTLPVETSGTLPVAGRVGAHVDKGEQPAAIEKEATDRNEEKDGTKDQTKDDLVSIPHEVSGAFLMCFRLEEQDVGCKLHEGESIGSARAFMANSKISWSALASNRTLVTAAVKSAGTRSVEMSSDKSPWDVVLVVSRQASLISLTMAYGADLENRVVLETLIESPKVAATSHRLHLGDNRSAETSCSTALSQTALNGKTATLRFDIEQNQPGPEMVLLTLSGLCGIDRVGGYVQITTSRTSQAVGLLPGASSVAIWVEATETIVVHIFPSLINGEIDNILISHVNLKASSQPILAGFE